MEYSVRLTGFTQIKQALKLLPDNLRKQAVRAGVNAGAREIRDIARQKVPVRTGRLKKAIKHKSRRGTRDEVVASVGWDYSKARYGHLVELGHTIVPRGKKGESNRGGNVIGHVPAKPHIRPALISGRYKAIRAIRRKIEEWIFKRAGR